MTAHGTPLTGSGSSTVLIGGRPAWRAATDVHTCPVTTGARPHGSGVVTTGSSTVLINGVPAARQGDVLVENGPPNTIVSGEPTVLIGGGETSTEPAWVTSLYGQLTSYLQEYNAAIESDETGPIESQLQNEVVNLYVTADGGEAVFSFRTDGENRIETFQRGSREDATVRMETDRETVDRITESDTPARAFREAIVDDDVTISGIGTLNGLKWWALDTVRDLLTFVGSA